MRHSLLAALAAPLAVLAATPAAATGATPAADAALPATGFATGLSNTEIEALSADAFYWGLNIAGFYELRYVFTQLEGTPAFHGLNRMQANDNLFDASVRYATTVNASTLYAGGMFDVSREPVVIEAPAVTDKRYWSIQALDQNVNWFLMVARNAIWWSGRTGAGRSRPGSARPRSSGRPRALSRWRCASR